jgi:hypothetical protein
LNAINTTFLPLWSRIAEVGTNTPEVCEGADFFPVSARNFTVAFISGRRYSSGFKICTLTCTVAFCRLASGEIS